jgi:signal transduction histidine kinase
VNRLWVRFSLVFAIAVLTVPLLFSLYRVLDRPGPPPRPGIPRLVPRELENVPDEVRERIRNELWRDLSIVLIASSAIGLGVGVWLSRSLTTPLSELETAAHALEAQDFGHRVSVQGTQELVAVANAFNRMAAQLEKAETLRRNLLADVAHELRGPLHLLQGNLQAILDGVYPLSQDEIVDLFDQTHHLTALINDLHELAQAEARQLPLARALVDIGELVQETVTAFEPSAAAQEVSLQIELCSDLPSLQIDAARIRQVLFNLLSNALRHTPSGGEIRVTVVRQDGLVHISVQDTGEGIPPADLEHVFDRFYRADSARSRERGGTGLGLAIVKAIVELHGGQATASSPGPGEGSTFTISLPARAATHSL